MRAEIGLTKLWVPHEDGEIALAYPPFRGTLVELAQQIDSSEFRLLRPNSSQTASLVDDAWKNPKGEYEKEIIEILQDALFYEFRRNLYVKKEGKADELCNGVFIEDNPHIQNNMPFMNREDLTAKLSDCKTIKTDTGDILVSSDRKVSYVPFGFKSGEQSAQELGKNAYIIGRYGEEGAEKIARVASCYNFNPYLFILDLEGGQEKTSWSALVAGCDGYGLGVDGGAGGVDWVGRAFGVLKTGGASSQKINQ